MGFDSWGGDERDRDQRRRNQGICTYSSARVEAAEEAQALVAGRYRGNNTRVVASESHGLDAGLTLCGTRDRMKNAGIGYQCGVDQNQKKKKKGPGTDSGDHITESNTKPY